MNRARAPQAQLGVLALTMLLAMALPVTAAGTQESSGEVAFSAPAAGGVVKAGSQVAFRLDVGAGGSCAGLTVQVVLSAGGSGSGAVAGPEAEGCEGIVTVPVLPPDLEDAGVAAAVVASRDGDSVAAVPLRLRRLHAAHASSTSRDMTEEPTTDPRGGGTHLSRVRAGDAISFDGVNLTGISSASFRVAIGDSGGARLELRVDGADGPLLGAVQPTSTGSWNQWTSVTAPVEPQVVPEGPFELFVVVLERPYQLPAPPHPRDLPLVCGLPAVGDSAVCERELLHLNHIELNGHGVAELWQFPADDPGFEHIFDGTSLDGWRMAGPGGFRLTEDGEACSQGGMGLLWYEERTYGDFVLRSEFKVRSYRDNSGIFVRFPDPGNDPWVAVNQGYEIQIDDSFPPTQRTGSVYTFSQAHPLDTNAVGEWNALEIIVVGQRYDAVLNGTHVTTYQGSRTLEGYVGLQNNDYFAGSEVCFRDIRVKDLE